MKDNISKDTPKICVSIPIGSTVVVAQEDGGPWTYGTMEGKSNQNHDGRSYHIHITKRGQLVTQNRQHIKPTQISTEQYLWDQLHKHIKTDPLENILTQLEIQTAASNNNTNINN